MRESIGGSMLFWIVLFLFSIFIAFIAFIVKYSRVYKIKNSVINYITREEGNVTKEQIDAQLNKMDYERNGSYKICRYFPSDLGEFYLLELYSATELPMLGGFLSAVHPIKGETRIIKKDYVGDDLYSGAGTTNWFFGTDDQCFICNVGESCELTNVE